MSKEILLVVDAVSNEKGVEKDIIFGAIEAAHWRRQLAGDMAKKSTFALRSIGKPAITIRFVAGWCSKTNRRNSRCPDCMNCA